VSDSSDKVIFEFERRRGWCVDRLKTQLEKIKKITEDDLQKMQRVGTSGYYSQNHDILGCAFKIWTVSYELGVLKAMEKDITSAFKELSAPARCEADAIKSFVDPFSLPNSEDTEEATTNVEEKAIPAEKKQNEE